MPAMRLFQMRLNIKSFAAFGFKALVAITLVLMAFPVGRDMGARLHLYVALAQCVLIFLSTLATNNNRNDMHRCATWIFVIYAAHLVSALFFDRAFGREIMLDWQSILRMEAINLRPFFTIGTYIERIQSNSIALRTVVINLAGNMIMLAPLGVFLPIVFKKMRGVAWSLFTGAAVVILIEIIQRITGTGSLDIDDFILNFAGFVIVRLVMELPKIKRSYQKLL